MRLRIGIEEMLEAVTAGTHAVVRIRIIVNDTRLQVVYSMHETDIDPTSAVATSLPLPVTRMNGIKKTVSFFGQTSGRL